MNRAFTSKRQIAIFLGIAALVSGVVALFASAQTSPFFFEVRLGTSQTGTSQVFYDTGRGINELDSATASLCEGESSVRFPLPAGEYRSIRFDPIDHGYCRITIHQAAIVDSSGHVVRRFPLEEVSSYHDVSDRRITNGEMDLNMSAGESDPSLTIALAAPLVLTLAPFHSWQVALKAFFICFILVVALEVIWLLLVRRRWHWNGLLLCALGVFVLLGARIRFFAPINWDEEFYIWYGSLIIDGRVPYRDFVETHPPVLFFANALGLAVFGLKNFLFRIVPTGIAVLSIAVFCVAMVRRRIVLWLAVLLTAQVAVWLLGADFHETGLNDSESYGFAFTILGFSLGSLAAGSRRIGLQVLSGICLALAVLSKEFFVFSVIPAWFIMARRRDDRKLDQRQLLFSATGGIATGLAFLVYLVAHSAFGRYLDMIRFARTFAANYAVDIGKFPRVFGWSVLLPTWERLHNGVYNFERLAFVLPLWGAVFLLTLRQSNERSRIVDLGAALVALVLGMVGISVGFCFWNHYFLIGIAGLLPLSVLGTEAVSDSLPKGGRRASLTAFILLSAVFLFVATGPTRRVLAERLSRPILSWDPLVVETIEKHSNPGDYVLAPAGPLILVAMNRKNPYNLASPVDDILPYLGAEHPERTLESLRSQLERNLPKVCYFASSMRPRQKKWHELLYDPLLVKYQYVRVNDNLWYLPGEK